MQDQTAESADSELTVSIFTYFWLIPHDTLGTIQVLRQHRGGWVGS